MRLSVFCNVSAKKWRPNLESRRQTPFESDNKESYLLLLRFVDVFNPSCQTVYISPLQSSSVLPI
jgi:hypothetical protein